MRKKLLLHACCAPCSSGVVPQLKDFEITLLFYNPNIDTIAEYNRRLEALINYVNSYNQEYNTDINYIAIPYNHNEFEEVAKALKSEKEGGERCKQCINLRLDFTGKFAKENNYDIFASTLSVSPHKNANLINSLGSNISQKYNVDYLCSDFKKNNGFLNSITNSKKYKIYRQNYCGCEFAKGHLK